MFLHQPLALALGVFIAATQATADQTFDSDNGRVQLETVAEGLEHPWSLAFLPDGSQLATERAGRLRVIRDGELHKEPVTGVPDLVVAGQGGLLDVLLHPEFDDNQVLFLSYAHRSREGMTTRVARARFDGKALSDAEVIFEASPRGNTTRHFAGRMVFGQDGYLYISVGDRGEMERAQDTGEVWSHEHGPRGGDEINIIRAGNDYGWPKVTYGIDYSGVPISSRTTMEGVADPLHYWDPSIAPSGMAFYTGELFPQWQGDVFVGALKMRKLVRLSLDGEKVTEEEDLLTELGERIRDVRMGPDGALWLLTDSPRGKVYRMVPAK
jgi:glucose/arabinose dehydrogenase